jgi:hypothetical protein
MICSGWRPPACIIRPSNVSALVVSPASIASVKSHGGTPPASPRNGSIVGEREHVVGAIGAGERREDPVEAACVLPQPRPELCRGVRLDPQPGRSDVIGDPPCRSFGRDGGEVLVTVPTALTASPSFFGTAAVDDQHEIGGVERVREIAEQRRQLVGVEPADIAGHHHPLVGQERRRLRGIDDQAQFVLVAVELVDHHRSVAVADEVVDEFVHRRAQDRLVVAAEEVGRHGDLDSYRVTGRPAA